MEGGVLPKGGYPEGCMDASAVSCVWMYQQCLVYGSISIVLCMDSSTVCMDASAVSSKGGDWKIENAFRSDGFL